MLDELFSDSWSLYQANFYSIAAIVLPLVVPAEIFVTYYEFTFLDEHSSSLASLAPSAIVLPFYALFSATLVFFVYSVVLNQKLAISKAWEMGLKAWMPYLLLNVVVILLCGLGSLLLIVPGIYALIKFSFAGFEMLLRGQSLGSSLNLSWQRTEGYKGKLFVGLVVLVAIRLPITAFVRTFVPGSTDYLLIYTVTNILSALIDAYFVIYVFRVYWLAGEQHNKSFKDAASRQDASDAGAP